jgi:ABC-2 type transport system ATP-binding protein
MSTVLQVKNLTKIFYSKRRFFFFQPAYPPTVAVSNLTFSLKEGEILGILGPNGAGKTTLIEMLLGTMTPTQGEISYFGKNFFKHTDECLQFITHASAYNRLPSYLTVEESLKIYGSLYGVPHTQLQGKIDALLTQFKMQKYKKKPASMLSAGQMTRVMLIKAFLPQPKIMLLDEPTASLDPDIAQEVRALILKEQKENKVSIILTSHNMQEVAAVCDRALVLQKGIITKEDTPEMLAHSVALSRLTLEGIQDSEKALRIVAHENLPYTYLEGRLQVELDEKQIAPFLARLAQEKMLYERIDISKPTLEDYFLHLTKAET